MQVRQPRLLPRGRARQIVPRRVAGLAVQSRCQLGVHLLQHREGCSRQARAVGLGRHLVVQQVPPCGGGKTESEQMRASWQVRCPAFSSS